MRINNKKNKLKKLNQSLHGSQVEDKTKYLKEHGYRSLMVAADVYRPAAIDQLITLGKQIDVEVFSVGNNLKPEEVKRLNEWILLRNQPGSLVK